LSASAVTLYRADRYKKKIDNGIELFLKSEEPVLINFRFNVSLKLKMDKRRVKYSETNELLGTDQFAPNVTLDSAKYEVINYRYLIEK
jgi:hypothetical protein